MKASTKRILSILLSGVFLIGLIVVSTSLIRPALNDAMEKRALLYSKEQLFQNQSDAVGQVQSLIERFQGFDQLQSTINLAMPTNENATQILSQLTAISRNSGVQISSFQSERQGFENASQPLASRLGVLNVDLSIAGTYEGVRGFVELLESNVRVFNVSEIAFNSTFIEESDTTIVEADISFNAYFQEESTGLGSGADNGNNSNNQN